MRGMKFWTNRIWSCRAEGGANVSQTGSSACFVSTLGNLCLNLSHREPKCWSSKPAIASNCTDSTTSVTGGFAKLGRSAASGLMGNEGGRRNYATVDHRVGVTQGQYMGRVTVATRGRWS